MSRHALQNRFGALMGDGSSSGSHSDPESPPSPKRNSGRKKKGKEEESSKSALPSEQASKTKARGRWNGKKEPAPSPTPAAKVAPDSSTTAKSGSGTASAPPASAGVTPGNVGASSSTSRSTDRSKAQSDTNTLQVRLLQWNILAPTLAEGQAEETQFPDLSVPTDPWSGGVHYFEDPAPAQEAAASKKSLHVFRATAQDLDWQTSRRQKILDTIQFQFQHADLDFACLQEIEEDFYTELARPTPSTEGQQTTHQAEQILDGIFYKKRGRFAQDGSALLWNRKKWKLLRPYRQKLQDKQIMVAVMGRFVRLPEGATTKPAASLSPADHVVVCTTHFKAGFSDSMEDLRLEQAQSLWQHLQDFCALSATTEEKETHVLPPIVICADLNSHCRTYSNTCWMKSATGKKELKVLDGPVLPRTVPFFESVGFENANICRKSGRWRSVEKKKSGGSTSGTEVDTYPEYTTWAGWQDRDVKAVLDYILLRKPGVAVPIATDDKNGTTRDGLLALQKSVEQKNGTSSAATPQNSAEIDATGKAELEFVGFESESAFHTHVASQPKKLPNSEYPSDHIALIANIRIQRH
ncbi:unnamed protein product [Amoebophrya sp. A120]|nr:unnamed protein product [Amoebophrya sp. A120]|eukprot:GSA120T00004789001.1